MSPEEEPVSSGGSSGPETTTAVASRAPRRGRRGGRGRRGRGRSRRPPRLLDEAAPGTPEPETEAAAGSEDAEERAEQTHVEEGHGQDEPTQLREYPPERHVAQQSRKTSPPSVLAAIDEVNHIIETLKETLDEMEEVLETLELAERQKNADEQEIETLRRSLHQLRRPREDQRRPHSSQQGQAH